MRTLYRCLACLGEYYSEQVDGYRYFHVCPPLVDKDTGAPVPRDGARDENLAVLGSPEHVARTGVADSAPKSDGLGREELK